MPSLSSQDRTLYWKPKVALELLRQADRLDHVSSDQLKTTRPGDTVWALTVINGELFLIGKLLVDIVTNRAGAIGRLGNNVWGNKQAYALAVPGTEEALKKISLRNHAKNFVFVSKTNNQLRVGPGGYVNGQELQSMRILTPSTSQLFDQEWKTH